MATNVRESELENIIVNYLVDNNGYELGNNDQYNKEFTIDEGRFFRFLNQTQADKVEDLHILDSALNTRKFLTRLRDEIGKRGIVDVLRNGIRHNHLTLDMYYPTPSDQNPTAQELYASNIFSVTRQLRYSSQYPNLALDFVVFINGLPISTFELKNQLSKQNVDDAVHQYKTDRDPKELIFNFKRCMVHFAVDDKEVKMCTHLCGQASWFLPFNKGREDGSAGNPVNPNGLRTDYLWKDILSKSELSNILENFAQLVTEKNEETKKIKETMIFPRYHQLSAVKSLLADTRQKGVGNKYLIQHSAGSGKSNSIAWLAYQLVVLEREGLHMFDSVIVVTDRVNLDKQIRNTIRQFMQEKSTVGWAEDSATLKELISSGKKIIITTVHKFPYILDSICNENRDKNFAIIIDEAHSSQNGSLSAKMNIALSGNVSEEDDDLEDKINRIIEGRKMVKNANYYAFTATPKNKTLEMFGVPFPKDDGETGHRPFHVYTMKQATQEGFIVDVLRYYTPIQSHYQLAKAIKEDSEFDKKKSQKKLRAFVEGDLTTIEKKSEIIVEHFHNQVISKGKIGGQARAMVVTAGIERAIDYYFAITRLLRKRRSQFKAIVAFSGEKDYKGMGKVSEATINDFPSKDIEKKFKNDPYRFLIVANKFQTGYDEPLLHTMYVDKVLTDIKAVQTLSRLNRAHPQKRDTFVLDFANDTDTIKAAFQRYYQTTILSAESDPNKLNDLIDRLNAHQVYTQEQIDRFVELFLNNADRADLDPILDESVEIYTHQLELNAQIEFKGTAKSFVRTYTFLSSILPFGSTEWEKLSIFLSLLINKLPSPEGDDLSEGILDAVDFDSYKNTILEERRIALEDGDAEVEPIPIGATKGAAEPDMDRLSNIITSFNNRFGDIDWTDIDKIKKQIAEIPEEVAKNEAYQNAIKNANKETARLESNRALLDIILKSMTSGLELYKEFQDNPSFQKWLQEYVFESTYQNRP